jgi:hypothetical protein
MTTSTVHLVDDRVVSNGTITHSAAKSGNAKLRPHRPSGRPVAATYRTYESCPTTCAFLGNGCYAAGRIESTAKKWGSTGSAWAELLARDAPFKAYLRHNVVGDILGNDDMPDEDYIAAAAWLLEERPDLVPFGYTHTWDRPDINPDVLPGAVMNASCESARDIVTARAQGWDTVITVATIEDMREAALEADSPITLCPAQRRDDIGCGDCGLCAKSGRAVTVAFLTHGSGHKKAEIAINSRKEH